MSDEEKLNSDDSFCNDLYDENGIYIEHYVAGYLCDEIEICPQPTRDGYTNEEINEHLSAYFNFFGQKDMDINYLYFLSRKKQLDIKKILKKTQPAISYDVTRIRQQIEFVIKMVASVDDFVLFITGNPKGLTTFDKEVLTVFFYTTSIVKTARVLKLEGMCIRSIIKTCVSKLQKNGHSEMHELFQYILSNLNNVKKHVDKDEG